jgi:hypothetical protein
MCSLIVKCVSVKNKNELLRLLRNHLHRCWSFTIDFLELKSRSLNNRIKTEDSDCRNLKTKRNFV